MSEMTAKTQENQPNPSIEQLDEVCRRLTVDQMRFVVARQEFPTDKAAAENIGINPNTVSAWKRDGAPVDDAVKLMAFDGLVIAAHIRRRHLAKAMAVKVAGLDDDDSRLRQGVATEIIEWEMGKATQRAELSGKDGGPIETRTRIDVDQLSDNELAALAEIAGRIAEDTAGEGEA